MENLSTSCPICFEQYTSDPACKDECLPVQSAKCPHVMCFDCANAIRDREKATTEKSTQGWITCPTCQAPSAFNADDPTVCLTMCEFVRFTEDHAQSKQKEATATAQAADVAVEIQPRCRDNESRSGRRRNERKRQCKRSVEGGKEKRKKASKDERSNKDNRTHIFLASSAGAEGKFLATVVPLLETDQGGDLPHKLTLDGFTRQKWSTADGDDSGPWKTMYLRSVDKKRYLEGFLKNLKERKKAAFGTYLLPNGTDGFFVVPFNQPPPCPEASTIRSEKVVFCKYVLGMNLVGGNGSETTKEDLESAAHETQNKIVQESGGSSHRNLKKIVPDGNDSNVESSGCSPGLDSLGGILGAQLKTEKHLAAVAKMPKRKITQGLQGYRQGSTPSQDWFSVRLNVSSDSIEEHCDKEKNASYCSNT